MESSPSLPLHHCIVHKLWSTLNRTYFLLNLLALAAIFYYRGAFFFTNTDPKYNIPFVPWLLLVAAEILLAFVWLVKQPFYWRLVTRIVFPERLPRDEELPGIDVFICTADPDKEPTLEVMNTVISAMALDYPVEKLSVYLSDDGGASVTLMGMKEAWVFATWWLPFCKRYNVKPICPQAYFVGPEQISQNSEFIEERKIIKEKYEVFKQQVRSKIQSIHVTGDAKTTVRDHPALVQVIDGKSIEDDSFTTLNPEHGSMPLLVYVAREKRPSHPHNFKAGALNILLRVSSTLSNSPYILVLDCDMYCNDSSSARRAMCFYLDPKIFPSLGWVQFPQKFHNVSASDIYDSQMRTIWPVLWQGVDGLQGPVISGTNVYIKREALFGIGNHDGNKLMDQRDSFDPSNEFIKSLCHIYKPSAIKTRESSSVLLQEAQYVASCAYEKGTKWGEKVGFLYDSVAEDMMTGFFLQSKGWRSVYLNPPTPQFLGSAAINLNEALIQGIRWCSGLLGVGLSKYCPLTYRPSKLQIPNKMCLAWLTLFPLDNFPVLCYATIPPLCFLHGIPMYPKVSNPFFIAFAFVFISSRVKQLCEVHISGGSVSAWFNEQRIWMIKAVTCYVYGTLDCIMTKLGIREASFIPTNKAEDKDKTKYYQLGKYDFRTSNMFLIPLVTAVTINLICFVGGVARMIISRSWDDMFAQMSLSLYVLVMSSPVIEGMMLRTDNGRVPLFSTLISSMVSFVFVSLGYLSLFH